MGVFDGALGAAEEAGQQVADGAKKVEAEEDGDDAETTSGDGSSGRD